MFKSCDYCRHRKKRCIVASSGRCDDCEHLQLPCVFSARTPSSKRRYTSQQVAARLGLERQASINAGDTQDNLSPTPKVLLPAQDCVTEAEAGTLSTAEKYSRHVRPFLPFVSEEMLVCVDPFLEQCINAAFRLSLNGIPDADSKLSRSDLSPPSPPAGSLTLEQAAGMLLLLPCVYLESKVVYKVFQAISPSSTPSLILAGALSAHAWRRLLGLETARLPIPAKVLSEAANSVEPASFSHHYLRMAELAVRFDRQCEASMSGPTDNSNSKSATQLAWARLEYDCLLWHVRLPSHLLDLRDDLPATPESIVLHNLSNLLLLSFYGYILTRADSPDSLGSLLALRPVPGVLYFVCALARSVFLCPRAILDRWALIVDIRAATARLLLRLWQQTHFENCRATLALWGHVDAADLDSRHVRNCDLDAQIGAAVGPGPWAADAIDGYSVFWTFRDLRTLTIELICGVGKG